MSKLQNWFDRTFENSGLGDFVLGCLVLGTMALLNWIIRTI